MATVIMRQRERHPVCPDLAASSPAGSRVDRLRLALKTAMAAGVLAVLYLLVDWPKAGAALAAADPEPLLAAFIVSALGVAISAFKWDGILRHLGIRLGFPEAARLYWIGMFASNLLPSNVGGDAVRLLLTPARDRMTQVMGSILVERLTGFVVLLVLCAIGLTLRPAALADGLAAQGLLLTVLGLLVVAVAILATPHGIARLMGGVHERLPRLLGLPFGVARRVAASAAPACSGPAIRDAFLVSLPFYATIILAQYGALLAVGAETPLYEVALLAPLVCLLAVLPVPLNGLGFNEGVFVLIYASAGVPPELGLAAAVLRRLVDLLNSSLGGFLWLRQRPDLAGMEAQAHAGPARAVPARLRPASRPMAPFAAMAPAPRRARVASAAVLRHRITRPLP